MNHSNSSELFPVFVSKVMSHRLQYVVGFTFLSLLHPIITNKRNEHKQLHNTTSQLSFYIFKHLGM